MEAPADMLVVAAVVAVVVVHVPNSCSARREVPKEAINITVGDSYNMSPRLIAVLYVPCSPGRSEFFITV